MKIQVLVDNPNSWILPYSKQLILKIQNEFGIKATLLHNHKDVKRGDLLFLLACEKIFKDLNYNTHNLVIHESNLPKGKGWSPLTWQILEGENKIPITLFEAVEAVDAGEIYLQDYIELDGHELLEEIKHQQGLKTIDLILEFIKNKTKISGKPQEGESTFYAKRGPKNSALDISKSIDEQFNLLRIVDNERYPAFFIKNGQKYIVKIYKDDL
ncbi:formyltransferase family protein [Bizionia myxarmorum]|uniref:Methionyl-tRNA formyltransferase n=1 Tax=Bizionia myxarmorum TaxID=291186 RepID=A0A5D0RB73_9FLAO|nr:formyltransferase family protein [Bizionia myxarmorum]TYB78757.1 methionyl-tRNA formyltransferase [Bizionia myxarmorum]